MHIDINIVNDIAIEAGRKIMEIYRDGIQSFELKEDKSPLTIADKVSNTFICGQLKHYFPDIGIISEENKTVDYETRLSWQYFFLVDPLDGTKEFLNRNDEFTVNIALICNNAPILGVIYAPAKGLLYYARKNSGAFRKTEDGRVKRLNVNNEKTHKLTAVKSRSHSTEEEEKFLSGFSIGDIVHAGSSLKFCMLAEGQADIYYRHGNTSEWDTAAGHAIVECSGGCVYSGKESMKYNKLHLKNSSFLAVGNSKLWIR